jgi:hypothetical protein
VLTPTTLRHQLNGVPCHLLSIEHLPVVEADLLEAEDDEEGLEDGEKGDVGVEVFGVHLLFHS